MEYTGNCYLPIAQFLQNNGFFVSVINPLLLRNYGTKSIHKAKTDKKDALKLASYALNGWLLLPAFSLSSDTRNLCFLIKYGCFFDIERGLWKKIFENND